jgi:hypothetical protein
VRPLPVRLLPAAALLFVACYAEFPGSAPVDDQSDGLFPDSGTPGAGLAGGLAGGGMVGGGDTGVTEPMDAGMEPDTGVVTNCEGSAVGTVQTRKLYAEAQVVPPATCKSETQMRTCRNTGWSAWSGTFKAESCMQSTVRSCGDVAHGATETREVYPEATVDDYSLCVADEQTRECNDGTFGPWSGDDGSSTCEVAFLGRCSTVLAADHPCVATTACTFKSILTGSQCLGATGHTCSANAECQSGVCVNGACVAAKVPVTGQCDEAADCASCSAGIAATCSSANQCVCGNGANCANNSQCLGTCVATKCVATNTTCDNDDDCTTATSKCVKPGAGLTGSCLLKDGQSCTSNAQCEHVCRAADNDETFAQRTCQPKGGSDAHCDENADCTNMFVCRPEAGQSLPMDKGTHCQALGQATELCDESADCAQTVQTSCTNVNPLGLICVPVSTGNQGGGGGGGPGGNG